MNPLLKPWLLWSPLASFICPDVHEAEVVLVAVVVDLVLVEEVDVDGTTGTKTTSFICSGIMHV